MDYITALERAILYIENHLGTDLRVEAVAKEAGYSYYHFTRLFSAILGESVGGYIKKRRLSEAAHQLLYSDRLIIDIALEVGFGSAESFSRAFKSIYHVSPVTYRKNRTELLIGAKPRLDIAQLNHLSENLTTHPAIVTLPDIKVAGLPGQTTLNDNVLPSLWAEFLTKVSRIPHKTPNGRGFGICEACSEGNTLYTMNGDLFFTGIAAVEVDSFDGLTAPFVSKVLKAGRYAVFTHTGSLSRLPESYAYIWGTWSLETKEKLDEREDFELYDKRFLGYDNPKSRIDLYIPIC